MKTALITTTINVPHVLSLYRAHDPDVRFFVAGDYKTPVGIEGFWHDLGNCEYYSPERQKNYLSYKCSELIGWNTKSRRNIATLEALKWGAEIVVIIDDDNIPVSADYFKDVIRPIERGFSGIKAGSDSRWFDPGDLQFPLNGGRISQRGFPQHALLTGGDRLASVVGAKVGVVQGMVLGDPDCSAIDRISQSPMVHQVSELLRTGIVCDLDTWTVFNSQNTALARDIVPAFFLPTHLWHRYDDIFSSLIVQRVMREHCLHVHFGPPPCWQQRNPHDSLVDLKGELWGMERIVEFAAWLDGFFLPGHVRATDAMKIFFTNLPAWMPDKGRLQELVLAWTEDCERVMK